MPKRRCEDGSVVFRGGAVPPPHPLQVMYGGALRSPRGVLDGY